MRAASALFTLALLAGCSHGSGQVLIAGGPTDGPGPGGDSPGPSQDGILQMPGNGETPEGAGGQGGQGGSGGQGGRGGAGGGM